MVVRYRPMVGSLRQLTRTAAIRDRGWGGSASRRAGGERVGVGIADWGRVEGCCDNKRYGGQGRANARLSTP